MVLAGLPLLVPSTIIGLLAVAYGRPLPSLPCLKIGCSTDGDWWNAYYHV